MQVRIKSPDDGRVMGTSITTADGHPIRNVTKVELLAVPGDLWRAGLTVLPVEVDVTAIADESRTYVARLNGKDVLLIDWLREHADLLGYDLVKRG